MIIKKFIIAKQCNIIFDFYKWSDCKIEKCTKIFLIHCISTRIKSCMYVYLLTKDGMKSSLPKNFSKFTAGYQGAHETAKKRKMVVRLVSYDNESEGQGGRVSQTTSFQGMYARSGKIKFCRAWLYVIKRVDFRVITTSKYMLKHNVGRWKKNVFWYFYHQSSSMQKNYGNAYLKPID